MPERKDLPVSEMLDKLRQEHCVPMGILAYDVETGCFLTALFTSIEPEEFKALLVKEGIKFNARRFR